MRTYLESVEVGEVLDAEFIRADVTGMAPTQERDILTAMVEVMRGVPCKFQRHLCNHDREASCYAEEVDVTGL